VLLHKLVFAVTINAFRRQDTCSLNFKVIPKCILPNFRFQLHEAAEPDNMLPSIMSAEATMIVLPHQESNYSLRSLPHLRSYHICRKIVQSASAACGGMMKASFKRALMPAEDKAVKRWVRIALWLCDEPTCSDTGHHLVWSPNTARFYRVPWRSVCVLLPEIAQAYDITIEEQASVDHGWLSACFHLTPSVVIICSRV